MEQRKFLCLFVIHAKAGYFSHWVYTKLCETYWKTFSASRITICRSDLSLTVLPYFSFTFALTQNCK
jgi:hypothetical protein